MLTTTKDKVIKTTKYVAYDNTEFDDADECKKYESSAVGVLLYRLQEAEIFRGNTECDVFGFGSDEWEVRVYKTDQLIHQDYLNQLYKIFYPDCDFKFDGLPVVVHLYFYKGNVDNVMIRQLNGLVQELTNNKYKIVKKND